VPPRVHLLLDPARDEPPVRRPGRREAEDHPDLHLEPEVRAADRDPVVGPEEEHDDRHPAEQAHLECDDRHRVDRDRGPEPPKPGDAAHRGQGEVLEEHPEEPGEDEVEEELLG